MTIINTHTPIQNLYNELPYRCAANKDNVYKKLYQILGRLGPQAKEPQIVSFPPNPTKCDRCPILDECVQEQRESPPSLRLPGKGYGVSRVSLGGAGYQHVS